MAPRNTASPQTLAWSSDLNTASDQQPAPIHILTQGFANRHVVVWLLDRSSDTIVRASRADVLGGRGKHLDHHPGNVRLTELVEMFKTAYYLSTPSKKREIVGKILGIVQDEGRRFLTLVPYQRDANIWIWAEEPKSRAKVSQKLRDAYKKWTSKRQAGVVSKIGSHLVARPLMPSTSTTATPFDQGDSRRFQEASKVKQEKEYDHREEFFVVDADDQTKNSSESDRLTPQLLVTDSSVDWIDEQRLISSDEFRLVDSIPESCSTSPVSTGAQTMWNTSSMTRRGDSPSFWAGNSNCTPLHSAVTPEVSHENEARDGSAQHSSIWTSRGPRDDDSQHFPTRMWNSHGPDCREQVQTSPLRNQGPYSTSGVHVSRNAGISAPPPLSQRQGDNELSAPNTAPRFNVGIHPADPSGVLVEAGASQGNEATTDIGDCYLHHDEQINRYGCRRTPLHRRAPEYL